MFFGTSEAQWCHGLDLDASFRIHVYRLSTRMPRNMSHLIWLDEMNRNVALKEQADQLILDRVFVCVGERAQYTIE